MGGASGESGIMGAERCVAPRGIVIAACAAASVGNSLSPACTPLVCRMNATSCAVVSGPSDPGLAGGIFVAMNVKSAAAFWPPQFRVKVAPRSELANSLPPRLVPWQLAQLFA